MLTMHTFFAGRTLRFFLALGLAVYFFARMDILIWQRIIEAHALWDLGMGVYHWGWMQALFGFMAIGALLSYPHLRRAIAFPLSLAILVFSGLEDVLYYWLDGRSIPAELPWLNQNPLILKPITDSTLLVSAGFWLLFVILAELLGVYIEQRGVKLLKLQNPEVAEV